MGLSSSFVLVFLKKRAFLFRHSFEFFCKKQPLFIPLLFIYLGAGFHYLNPLFLALWTLFFIYLTFLKNSFLLSLFYLLIGFCYFFLNAQVLPQDFIKGNAQITIHEKKEVSFFGKPSILYKGIVTTFKTVDEKIYEKVPFVMTKSPHFSLNANFTYTINEAEIHVKERGYILKIGKDSKIIKSKKLLSLVEWRFLTKQKLLYYLKRFYSDQRVYKFICAMTLGYLDSKTLSFEFSKTGIGHLLTISGFHFVLIATFLTFFLKPLPKSLFYIIMLILLTAYVIYLGPMPSVSRSWIAITFFFITKAFQIPSCTLNHLCLAGLISFFIDPYCLTSIGFQLSYLATFGILAFYQRCEILCNFLLPKRSLKTLFSLSGFFQVIFYFFSLLKKSIALDTAVNLATWPLIFFYFDSFPLLSLYYNLLIPLLIIPSFYLLLLGFFCFFSDFLATLFHGINDCYLEKILYFIAASPKNFEVALSLKNRSADFALGALLITFLLMLGLDKKEQNLLN